MEGDLVENWPGVFSQYVSLALENSLVLVKMGEQKWQLCDCLTGSTAIFNGKSFELVCAHGMALVCDSVTDEQHWPISLFDNDMIRGGQGTGECFLSSVVDGNH